MTQLLPDDDDLELLHTRNYVTRVYRRDQQHLLVRGAVQDTKPPGMYVVDDPEPLDIHHMVVELTVAIDGFEITDADVTFKVHPAESCPVIIEHYRSLIGLSIARGFTRKVRELFGGPRGCAHTTALLQAMAPAVLQSMWSVAVSDARANGGPPADETAAHRERAMARNLNTCHVWDEHGEHVALIRKREASDRQPPMQVTQRLIELGRDPDEWFGTDR